MSQRSRPRRKRKNKSKRERAVQLVPTTVLHPHAWDLQRETYLRKARECLGASDRPDEYLTWLNGRTGWRYSPTACFYAGVAHFCRGEWDEAVRWTQAAREVWEDRIESGELSGKEAKNLIREAEQLLAWTAEARKEQREDDGGDWWSSAGRWLSSLASRLTGTRPV